MKQRRFGIAFLFWLGLIFIWLPIEDNGLLYPIGLGLIASILIFLRWIFFGEKSIGRWRRALLGAMIGATAPLIAAFLMIFKSGIHGHGFPEFSISMIGNVLGLWPIATMLGLVAALLWKGKISKKMNA